MSARRVLGIDPGLGRMGWAVVAREGSAVTPVAFGLIETKPGHIGSRLSQIGEEVAAVCQEHKPTAAALERLFFTKNQTTGLDVAKAAGVALSKIYEAGIEAVEMTPSQVKQAVTGNGRATKEQVAFMVTRLLSLAQPPKPDDVADALAVALAEALYQRR
ncbi:MAG: crossover junction endodeoxyribonuclease RuvC [Fimbriimonadaceae bacterium]